MRPNQHAIVFVWLTRRRLDASSCSATQLPHRLLAVLLQINDPTSTSQRKGVS